VYFSLTTQEPPSLVAFVLVAGRAAEQARQVDIEDPGASAFGIPCDQEVLEGGAGQPAGDGPAGRGQVLDVPGDLEGYAKPSLKK
jgi:hypothetical protein